MKKTLQKLLEECERLGEKKVENIMIDCYWEEAQGCELLTETVEMCKHNN